MALHATQDDLLALHQGHRGNKSIRCKAGEAGFFYSGRTSQMSTHHFLGGAESPGILFRMGNRNLQGIGGLGQQGGIMERLLAGFFRHGRHQTLLHINDNQLAVVCLGQVKG